jgi:hypothetical protein
MYFIFPFKFYIIPKLNISREWTLQKKTNHAARLAPIKKQRSLKSSGKSFNFPLDESLQPVASKNSALTGIVCPSIL